MKPICLLVLLAAAPSFAANRYWLNPASADWTEPAAWQGGAAPTPADTVYFRYDATSTVTATQSMDITRGYVNGKGTLTFDFAPGVVLLSSNNFALSQSADATGGKTLHLKSGTIDLLGGKTFYIGDGTGLGTNTLILSSPNAVIRNGTLQTATWSCDNLTVISNGASLVNVGLIVGNSGASASNNFARLSGAVLTNMAAVTVGASGSRNTLIAENTPFHFSAATSGKDFIVGQNVSATGNTAVLRGCFVTNFYQMLAGFKGSANTIVLSNSQVFAAYTVKAGTESETIAAGSSDNAIQVLDGSLLYAGNSVWLGDNVRGDWNGRNRLLVSGPASRLIGVGGITIGGKCSDNRVDVADGAFVGCPNGGITVGYGNLTDTTVYGCNRNALTVTNSVVDLGTTLTVGAATFTGCTATGCQADIASNSVVNTRGYANINSRYPGVIVGHTVRASNNVVRISSGSVFTNAYGLMVGNEGSGNSLVADRAELVANGGQSVIGEAATASGNTLALLNGARFVNASSLRFYLGMSGPANVLALTNATFTGASFGIGSASSSSNNVLAAKDSQLSLDYAIFGDWGQRNLIALDNSQCDVATELVIGYQTASTQNVVRLSGTNPVLRADSLSVKNGAVLEFEVPKAGYAQVPIQCTASGGSSNLTFQANNVRLKVTGEAFQRAGGGWVVLATNFNKTISGTISELNCDLPKGATLVNSARTIAVRLPSFRGTLLCLQ